jgi:cellobiose phosphorylase
VAITQHILGISADYHGLKVYPVIPDDFGVYRVKRVFRGVVYDIEIDNRLANKPDKLTLCVEGEPVQGNIIKWNPSDMGRTIRVSVRF